MKTMSLQKKNQVPANKPGDIIQDAEELRSFIGQKVTVAIFDNTVADLSVMGSLYLTDLPPYIAQNEAFPKDLHLRLDQFMLLSVIVMDPENLPYEIGEDYEEVFVMYDNWDLTRHKTMEEATYNIESTIDSFTTATIEDFVVLIGREYRHAIAEKFAQYVLLNFNEEVKNGKKCIIHHS